MALRRAHGKEALDVPHDSAQRRARLETWLNDSAEYTGNAGVWGPFSADASWATCTSASNRRPTTATAAIVPAPTCISDSLVCLDIKTGKMIWYQQLIHHDIWDYDMPPHPILRRHQRWTASRIKAVVQMAKQAFAYVFDRTNGQPVWPMTERPVPQTDVPKEWTSPTQPFPTKPPAFDRRGSRTTT